MSRRIRQLPASPVTIKDLADQLGVSHTTVSRALNDYPATSEQTKARVRRLAERWGYVRNAGPSLMQGTYSKLIGFIAPDVQNDFYSTVAAVLADTCAREGYQVVLAISEDDSELELRHVLALREARAAGIILTPTLNPTSRLVELLRPLPTIQLVRSSNSLDTRAVVIDDRLGTFQATTHLLELGHDRIGFIGGTEGLSTSRERLQGVTDAHRKAGRTLDRSLVELGAPRPGFAREALARLLALPKPPSALVLGSSQLTLGTIALLHERGIRVPEELSLVGYGDPPWFQFWGPGITTVELPTNEIAAAAVSSLFQRMRSHARAEVFPSTLEPTGLARFSPQLIVRGSTAPPAHAHPGTRTPRRRRRPSTGRRP